MGQGLLLGLLEVVQQRAGRGDRARVALEAEGVEVIDWPKEELAKLRAFTTEVQDELAARNPMTKKIIDSHRAHQRRVA